MAIPSLWDSLRESEKKRKDRIVLTSYHLLTMSMSIIEKTSSPRTAKQASAKLQAEWAGNSMRMQGGKAIQKSAIARKSFRKVA